MNKRLECSKLKYLKSGDRFIAVDKLGASYEYEFIGVEIKELNGCHSIILWNHTLNNLTTVEYGWFRERKLDIISFT